jgi:hypothetical protein
VLSMLVVVLVLELLLLVHLVLEYLSWRWAL